MPPMPSSARHGTGAPSAWRRCSQMPRFSKIYTSDLQRTQQTARPLAERQHLKPVAIPLSKPEDLIEAIRSGTAANVLVVWHGGTLPRIMHALGAPEVPPIEDPEYDRFLILTLAQNEKHSALNFTVLRYCDRLE